MKYYPVAEREKLMELSQNGCFLDDLPAKVVGRLMDSGLVRNDKYHVQYSWAAIDRILHAHKHFKS